MLLNIIIDFYVKIFIGIWYTPYFFIADLDKDISNM